MLDGIEGFYEVNKDCIGFEAVLAAQKQGSFDDVLGFLASDVAELGRGVYFFESFHQSSSQDDAEDFGRGFFQGDASAVVGVLWVAFAFVDYSQQGSLPGFVVGVGILPEILDQLNVIIKSAGWQIFYTVRLLYYVRT